MNKHSRIVVACKNPFKDGALLPTAHRLQGPTAPALGWKVDLLADVLSLCNQLQNLKEQTQNKPDGWRTATVILGASFPGNRNNLSIDVVET